MWRAFVSGQGQKTLQEKGAMVGNTLVTIENGSTLIPVLSVNHDGKSRMLKPKDSTIALSPVTTRYQRFDECNNVLTDGSWKTLSRSVTIDTKSKVRSIMGSIVHLSRECDALSV